MKKLPPCEADRRHQERNRLKNEKRKIDLMENRINIGSTKYLTEDRKRQMREYIRTKRGLPAADPINIFLNMSPEEVKEKKRLIKNAKARLKWAATKGPDKRLKANRPASRVVTADKKKSLRNERERIKRANEKEAGLRIDKRLKENMTKPHYKVVNAKPKPARKPQTAKVKKMGKVVKEPKPMVIANSSVQGKIPLVINAKLTVYIRPDQDPEVVRAKYINRL